MEFHIRNDRSGSGPLAEKRYIVERVIKYCPLEVGYQEGLGNRWIEFVLWFTQLHGS